MRAASTCCARAAAFVAWDTTRALLDQLLGQASERPPPLLCARMGAGARARVCLRDPNASGRPAACSGCGSSTRRYGVAQATLCARRRGSDALLFLRSAFAPGLQPPLPGQVVTSSGLLELRPRASSRAYRFQAAPPGGRVSAAAHAARPPRAVHASPARAWPVRGSAAASCSAARAHPARLRSAHRRCCFAEPARAAICAGLRRAKQLGAAAPARAAEAKCEPSGAGPTSRTVAPRPPQQP